MNAKQRLYRHLPFVVTLARLKSPEELQYFLGHLTHAQLLVLRDIVKNAIIGNIPLSPKSINYLRKKQKRLTSLVRKPTHQNLNQVGSGVFSLLLPALVSLLMR